MKLIEFTSHDDASGPILIDPDEVVSTRPSGGRYDGSTIIALRGRSVEIFVKESLSETARLLKVALLNG